SSNPEGPVRPPWAPQGLLGEESEAETRRIETLNAGSSSAAGPGSFRRPSQTFIGLGGRALRQHVRIVEHPLQALQVKGFRQVEAGPRPVRLVADFVPGVRGGRDHDGSPSQLLL